jgi:hypothetical protein
MNKICEQEFINVLDSKMWCKIHHSRCMGRSSCMDFVDGSESEQEESFALKCPKCGYAVGFNLEETGPHTKALCKKCGAYIKMVSKKEIQLIVSCSVAKAVFEAENDPTKVKRVFMSKAEALDYYIDMKNKIKKFPEDVQSIIIKEALLVQLTALAESHGNALSRIEELEKEINHG